MSDLRLARVLMNWQVRQDLESRPIYDPASFDDPPPEPPPLWWMTEDEYLDLDDGGTTPMYGRLAPRAPWEIAP